MRNDILIKKMSYTNSTRIYKCMRTGQNQIVLKCFGIWYRLTCLKCIKIE